MRNRLGIVSKLLSLIAMLLLVFQVSMSAVYTEERKPNIIFIVTDDQGYADLSAYPHAAKDCLTPHIDRIANNGVLFTHGYATAPVCSPSRASMLTGKYQGRWDKDMYWSPGLPKNVETLAEMLKKEGYITAKIGKSDYGRNYHNPNAREFPTNHGYDYFLGFSAHAHDYFLLDEAIEKATPDPYGYSESLGRLFRNEEKVSFENTYTTNLFTDEAISFVTANKGEPFFLDLSYNSVHHLIHEVPQEYLDKWQVRKIKNYDPSYGKYADYYWDYTQVGKISDDVMRRYYLANLNCLDDNIGRLLDSLQALGILENTLIVLISDNGGEPLSGANNIPLSGSKYTMYEGGIRVPFIVSWPRHLPKGEIYRHRVSALDLVPTCLQAAGARNVDLTRFDGSSLLTAIKTKTASESSSEPLFFKFEKHYAVIHRDWKLVFTEDYNPADRPITSQIRLGSTNNQLALFDLKSDQEERFNLIEAKPAKVKDMMNLFQSWLKEMKEDNENYMF